MSETLKQLRWKAQHAPKNLSMVFPDEILELIDAEAARAEKYKRALVSAREAIFVDGGNAEILIGVMNIIDEALR